MTDDLTSYRLSSNGRLYAILGAVVLLVALFAYCAGTRHEHTADAIAQITKHRDTVMDTIRVVERRIVVDTQRVRVTAAAAQVKRASFDSAEKSVVATADSAPQTSIAAALPALHVCDQALAADSVSRVALEATVADLTVDRDAQRSRAEDDERELKILKPPRLTFTEGLVVGITLAEAATHPATVVKAVVWVAHLF